MRMAMLVRVVAGQLFHGDDAPVELLAADVLELDGGMADMEAVS